MIWDTTTTTMHRDPRFFTRGDGLALYQTTYRVESGHSGPSDMPVLGLVEYNASGQLVPGAMFDADDFDRGYAELNARYMASLSEDERAAMTVLLDTVAPDLHMIVTHVLGIAGNAVLAVCEAEERVSIAVFEMSNGQLQSVDNYEIDQIDEARAHFDEIAVGSRAVSTWRGVVRSWNAHDWNGVVGHIASEFDASDARPFSQVADYDFVADLRVLFSLDESHIRRSKLEATRGDHLAVVRMTFAFNDHNAGEAEMEALGVFEVNDDNLWSRMAIFDATDLEGAMAALEQRSQC